MLSIDNQIKIVTGKGAWHTNDCEGSIPSLCMSDGPHGLRKQADGVMDVNDSIKATCFPTSSALACSFDEELVAEVAQAIAQEAKAENVHIVLGPGINIKRSPLCGRNFEYYSEDPYLAGVLATAYVKAMQEMGVGCSLKHFAANSQETHRHTSNSQVDERALREIYLSAFERVVKNAQPATIMASYNRINGDYACENKHLLKEILRDEWGFEGAVISDWGACVNLPKCIEAGMDLEMPESDGEHSNKLKNALKSGKISPKHIERAAGNVEKAIRKWAKPDIEYAEDDKEALLKRNHRLAKKAALSCGVLLKNDGLLPISNNETVILVGDLAERVRFQGGGSSHINAGNVPKLKDVLKNLGYEVKWVRGYDSDKLEKDSHLEEEALAEINNTKNAIVIFCGGMTDRTEGEGYDRTSYEMPENQISLYKKVRQASSKLVFLAFGGSPFDMGDIDNANAILHMYLAGEAVMEAAGDLLSGIANPCGRLAESYPFSIEDTTCYGNFGDSRNKDIKYKESIYVGYRYYDKFDVKVRYPFGYGLSYTYFEYSDLKLETITSGNVTECRATCTITNIGDRDGAECVQLYVRNPEEKYIRADKELKGFKKVFIKAKESKTISIDIPADSFSLFDEESSKYVVPRGIYEILIGSGSQDIRLYGQVLVSGIKYDRDDTKLMPGYFGTLNPTDEEFAKLYKKPFSNFNVVNPGDYSEYSTLGEMARDSVIAKTALWFAKKTIYSSFKDRSKDDPEVMMMISVIKDAPIDMVENQSGGRIKNSLVQKIINSANKRARK